MLEKSEMGILRTERSMVREMCGVQLKDRKRSTDFMFMMCLKEIIDLVGYGKQCSLACSCVEERGWSCHNKVIRF